MTGTTVHALVSIVKFEYFILLILVKLQLLSLHNISHLKWSLAFLSHYDSALPHLTYKYINIYGFGVETNGDVMRRGSIWWHGQV